MAISREVLVISFALILSHAYGAPNVYNCAEEMDVSRDIVGMDVLMEIINAYRYDPQVKAAIDHFESPEFLEKLNRLYESQEFDAFSQYFGRRNVLIAGTFNILRTGLPVVVRLASDTQVYSTTTDIRGGVKGLVSRILEKHISMEDIRDTIAFIMFCSPKLKDTISKCYTPEFEKLFADLRQSEEYIDLIQDLESYDIFLDYFFDELLKFLKDLLFL